MGAQGVEFEVVVSRGPSGTAHHSASCLIDFIMITVNLESQLETITNVPTEVMLFAQDGRYPHFASLVRPLWRTSDVVEFLVTFVQSVYGNVLTTWARRVFFAKLAQFGTSPGTHVHWRMNSE